MTPSEDHSDDAALAGEYALHLLDAAERSAFEKRMERDPALRDLVRDWDDQLALLTQSIAPVTPPPQVKAQLQATLFPAPPAQPRRVWAWLAGGLVVGGLVVAILFSAPNLIQRPGPQPAFTARVAAEDGSLLVAARFIRENSTLEISRQTGSALPGRALELWLIAEGADAPVSLGTLGNDTETRIKVSPELALKFGNAVLAISDEPLGGSPTGAPTGAVLAVGPVSEV